MCREDQQLRNRCALAAKNRRELTQCLEREFRPGWRGRDLLLVLGVMAFSMLLIFWRLGEGSIGDYDEAAYAQIAREILRTNDWNTLRWNGVEFFDKPPICLWVTALAYKVFGVNEFAARFCAALCGVGAVILTCFLGKKLFSSWAVGLGAALILLTPSKNLHNHGHNFLGLARVGMLDMPLIFLSESSLLLAWLSQSDPAYLIWLGIPLGLGVMVKSVAGFFAYFIVFAFFVLALPRSVWWRRELALGLLISALIIVPWHLGQLLVWGRLFFKTYMVQFTVGYVTGEQGHLEDSLFYVRSLVRGFPVWYVVVAIALAYAVYRAVRFRDRARILLLVAAAIPFIAFNASRSRIGWYIIPIYPALALLAAQLLVGIAQSRHLFREAGTKVGLLLIAVVWLVSVPGLPAVGDFDPDVKAVMSYSNYILKPDDKLIDYWPGSTWIRPSAAFYTDKYLVLAGTKDKMLELLQTGEYYILTDAAFWPEIAEVSPEAKSETEYRQIVYQRGNCVLAHSRPKP
jgi:4-amino-4-deoxy-L-arabinose transferase-like glycosyltransferase